MVVILQKKFHRLTWFVGFHVAAVFAVVIQLSFQNDKLEFSTLLFSFD